MRKVLAIVLLTWVASAQGALAAKANMDCEGTTRTMYGVGYGFTCSAAATAASNSTWGNAVNACVGIGFDGACPDSTEFVSTSCQWNGSLSLYECFGYRTYHCGYILDSSDPL